MKSRFLCFLLLISTISLAQTKLEYKLSVGDNFTVQQEARQVITQDLNGIDQIIENDLLGIMHFKVIDSEEDTYTMEMTFKRLKMLMSSPSLGELSNSDSDSADSSDVANMLFKGLLNVPVIIIMEKTGKIKSVTGGENLIASMFASAGMDQPEIIAESKKQMEKQFGSAALTNSFEQITYIYPIEPVAVGNQWTNRYVGNMSAKNIWSLTENSGNSIKIDGSASTTMSSIDENIIMTLSGNQKTSISVDPSNGLFKEITVTGENSGNTLFQAQNMTIPTDIKSIITYKILK
ncbi:DUF6263 family protein [Subsaxibacter sp. CAU 1640]|uniref:DUF6263 family protein n=1 Tax=Subsaxibacter sp. CAU 1640 TaxID=2933271 RepID=UPI002004E48A|nr:DUF6263 family protein [Subsaxibacter sp. CAU 1640]MCK7589943.1 DUF6263 family protein [Subsaxibacter sp. CAU 1640]